MQFSDKAMSLSALATLPALAMLAYCGGGTAIPPYHLHKSLHESLNSLIILLHLLLHFWHIVIIIRYKCQEHFLLDFELAV